MALNPPRPPEPVNAVPPDTERCTDVRLTSSTRCVELAGHEPPHRDIYDCRWISWSGQDGATGDVAGFLYLLRGNPTLLDEAPGSDSPDAIERRIAEGHACLRCGQPAAVALISHIPDAGSRWLDLCAPCGYWLRVGIEDVRRQEEQQHLDRLNRLGEAFE